MLTLYKADYNSPIGKIICFCDCDSIIRLLLPCDNEQQTNEYLLKKIGPFKVREANKTALRVCHELELYFNKKLRHFSVQPSFLLGSDFAKMVWEKLLDVPYGKLACYQGVADSCHLKGSRAVGNAIGSNPIPIIVPCHRIIRKNGQLGGFRGGEDAKRTLLHVEGHSFDERLSPSYFL